MEQVSHTVTRNPDRIEDDVLQIPSRIRVAHYRLTLQAVTPLNLPDHLGSTLRGGFGHVFRHQLCVQPRAHNCGDCILHSQCPYVYIFDTPVPKGAEVLSANKDAVRPFMIKAPVNVKGSYAPGDLLVFGLTLVGRAIEYLPYFVVVFQQLGYQGLGPGRGEYTLTKVEAVQPWTGEQQVVYSTNCDLKRDVDLTMARADFVRYSSAFASGSVSIRFVSPTRLKHRGELVWQGPPFHVLIKALLARVSSLSYFHCGERWRVDFSRWIDRARQIELDSGETHWDDWKRYSGRQDQWVWMGGLVGRATYKGKVHPFLPLLALGEAVQVGKKTVFGNGFYEVASPKLD